MNRGYDGVWEPAVMGGLSYAEIRRCPGGDG